MENNQKTPLSKMDLKEATRVLQVHQDWRRDNENRFDRMPHSPKELGIAIDVILEHLNKTK